MLGIPSHKSPGNETQIKTTKKSKQSRQLQPIFFVQRCTQVDALSSWFATNPDWFKGCLDLVTSTTAVTANQDVRVKEQSWFSPPIKRHSSLFHFHFTTQSHHTHNHQKNRKSWLLTLTSLLKWASPRTECNVLEPGSVCACIQGEKASCVLTWSLFYFARPPQMYLL